MKIGILTFQRTTNYGAIMQSYSLNKKLNDIGANCETIDYYNPKLATNKTNNLVKIFYQQWKSYNCNRFINKMIKMSKKVDKKNIHSLYYDCYVVGSDQVWNVKCTDNDQTYFIDFNDKALKYSYAASIGLDHETIKSILTKNKQNLNSFEIVSLRENIEKETLNSLNKKTRYDVDPVFLLSPSEWKGIASKKLKKKKYIFYYTIGKTKKLDSYVKELANKYNLEIIDNKKSIEFIMNCKPTDFISWLYNAEFVVTNSFHGAAFSIIFNKLFYVECDSEDGFNHRIYNMLNKYKLNTRIVDNEKTINNQEIDFADVNKRLKEDILNSIQYLKQIVSSKK